MRIMTDFPPEQPAGSTDVHETPVEQLATRLAILNALTFLYGILIALAAAN